MLVIKPLLLLYIKNLDSKAGYCKGHNIWFASFPPSWNISVILEEIASIRKERFYQMIKVITPNNCVLISSDLSYWVDTSHASISTVGEYSHSRGQAFNPVWSFGVLQTCTRPLVKNIVKDDSSDHITYFHFSVDLCL